MYLKVLLLQILALLYLTNFSAQTLIINEVSQGESGNMEFIEFVVVDNSAVYDCGDLLLLRLILEDGLLTIIMVIILQQVKESLEVLFDFQMMYFGVLFLSVL